MRSRLVGVVVVTVTEAPAVYFWLRLHEDGHEWWALLSLVLGELLETGLAGLLVARRARSPNRARSGPAPPLTRMQRLMGAASVAEIVLWVLWLFLAEEIGQPVAAGVLLVLMHIKHHVELVGVSNTPFGPGFFSVKPTFASAMETAGAVACLALLLDGQPGLAAVALGLGFLVEHSILVDVLLRELVEQDARLPGGARP